MEHSSNGVIKSCRARVIMRRQAFTLPQLLLVLVVVSVLATIALSVFTRARTIGRRNTCDMQLKTLTVALDAFREETGRYPEHLDELVTKKYLTDPAMLKCPADTRANGSYDEYYVMRAARDSGELPILFCPICSKNSNSGMQAFKGRYTKQFATKTATISKVSNTTIDRPGQKPFQAKSGMAVRSGDIIRTASGGNSLITFADGSSCNLSADTQITVLQSFIAGQTYAPLYTTVRQTSGEVSYSVNHGSKFDVSTPAATAVALGTAFQIKQDDLLQWWLKVTESKVLVSDLGGRDIVAAEGTTLPPPSDIPVMTTSQWTFLGQLESYLPLMPLMPPAGGMMSARSAPPTSPQNNPTRIRVLRSSWRQGITN
jgi:type II secretory pathway pseudopilin PulG